MSCARAALVVIALIASGCDQKPKPQAKPSARLPIPRPTSQAKPEGIEISEPRVRVSVATVNRPPIDQTMVWLSPSFELDADQSLFPHPVRITLKLDTADERAYPVLRVGGLAERLPGGKVDLVNKTLTFETDRLIPLIAACGAGGTDPVSASAAADREEKVELRQAPQAQILAVKSLESRARAMVDTVLPCLDFCRREYLRVKFPAVGKISIVFTKLSDGVAAQTTRDEMIEIDLALWESYDEATHLAKFVHEYFHAVQHAYKMKAIRTRNVEFDAQRLYRPGRDGWMREGSCEYMAHRLVPQGAAGIRDRIRADFGYLSLFHYDDELKDNHQYADWIFLQYLDTNYDTLAFLRRFYEEYFGGRITQHGAAEDEEYYSGSWDAIWLADILLRDTLDRQGRRRGFREIFPEFLVRFYWKKDFQPVVETAVGVGKDIAAPMPSMPVNEMDSFQIWKLPSGEDRSRRMKLAGDRFAILKAFLIESAMGSQSGDLHLRLQSEKRSEACARLIVFPIQDKTLPSQSTIYESIVIRGAQDPLEGTDVIVPSFEKIGGVLVWVVDLSSIGFIDHSFSAEVQGPSKMTWKLKVFGPEEGQTVPAGGVFRQRREGSSFRAMCSLEGATSPEEYEEEVRRRGPPVLRVTCAGRVPRYMSSLKGDRDTPIGWSSQQGQNDILVEALDRSGRVLDSIRFSVVVELPPPLDIHEALLKNIEKEKEFGSRERYMRDHLGKLAENHARNRRYREALDVLEEFEKKFGANASVCRSRVALADALDDYDGVVRALQQQMMFDSARSDSLRQMATFCLAYKFDLRVAGEYWEKYQESMRAEGGAGLPWPYAWNPE